jgi:predicted nucleic acid-binding protein
MIVDASVAVPWLIETPFSKSARMLKHERAPTPAFILVETASALLKYVRIGILQGEDFLEALETLPLLFDEMTLDADLRASATTIAMAREHSVYDCLYLALALERRKAFATADRRLALVARTLGIETVLIEAKG